MFVNLFELNLNLTLNELEDIARSYKRSVFFRSALMTSINNDLKSVPIRSTMHRAMQRIFDNIIKQAAPHQHPTYEYACKLINKIFLDLDSDDPSLLTAFTSGELKERADFRLPSITGIFNLLADSNDPTSTEEKITVLKQLISLSKTPLLTEVLYEEFHGISDITKKLACISKINFLFTLQQQNPGLFSYLSEHHHNDRPLLDRIIGLLAHIDSNHILQTIQPDIFVLIMQSDAPSICLQTLELLENNGISNVSGIAPNILQNSTLCEHFNELYPRLIEAGSQNAFDITTDILKECHSTDGGVFNSIRLDEIELWRRASASLTNPRKAATRPLRVHTLHALWMHNERNNQHPYDSDIPVIYRLFRKPAYRAAMLEGLITTDEFINDLNKITGLAKSKNLTLDPNPDFKETVKTLILECYAKNLFRNNPDFEKLEHFLHIRKNALTHRTIPWSGKSYVSLFSPEEFNEVKTALRDKSILHASKNEHEVADSSFWAFESEPTMGKRNLPAIITFFVSEDARVRVHNLQKRMQEAGL